MYNHKVIAIVLFFLCVEVALAAKKRPQPSPTANNTGHASYSSQVDKLEKEAYTFTLTDIELRARHKTYKTLKEKNDKFAATARSNIEKLSILITETDKALESKPEKAKRLQLKKRKRRLKEKRKDENKSLNKKNQKSAEIQKNIDDVNRKIEINKESMETAIQLVVFESDFISKKDKAKDHEIINMVNKYNALVGKLERSRLRLELYERAENDIPDHGMPSRYATLSVDLFSRSSKPSGDRDQYTVSKHISSYSNNDGKLGQILISIPHKPINIQAELNKSKKELPKLQEQWKDAPGNKRGLLINLITQKKSEVQQLEYALYQAASYTHNIRNMKPPIGDIEKNGWYVSANIHEANANGREFPIEIPTKNQNHNKYLMHLSRGSNASVYRINYNFDSGELTPLEIANDAKQTKFTAVFKPDGILKDQGEHISRVGVNRNAGMRLGFRSVATFKVAELLGMADLVPETVYAKMDDQYGTIQKLASGEAGQVLFRDSQIVQSDSLGLLIRSDSSKFLQKLADVEIFDILCGQLDRNPGNLFFSYTDDENFTVQLIDNDQAFGLNTTHGAKINTQVPFPTQLSKATIQRISELHNDKNKLRLAVSGLLSSGETDALLSRLDEIKKKIQANEIKAADKDEDWKAPSDDKITLYNSLKFITPKPLPEIPSLDSETDTEPENEPGNLPPLPISSSSNNSSGPTALDSESESELGDLPPLPAQ